MTLSRVRRAYTTLNYQPVWSPSQTLTLDSDSGQGKPGIVYDSQLPAGMESVKRIQELESQWNRAPEMPADEEKPPEAPQFVLKPEPCAVKEGDWARFCCRLTGHPRPRVMWLINGHTIVNVSWQGTSFF